MRPAAPYFRISHGRTPLTLELQFKTRDCEALSYAYLLRIRYDVTGSIELQFSSVKVVIEGRQLQPIYDALKEQTVVSIREADLDGDGFGGEETFIRSIAVTPLE